MTRADNDIYLDVASILSEAAPIGAAQMVMSAKLTPESDACRFTYDSVNGAGEKSWLVPGAKVNSSLMDLVVELRTWFVAAGLTAGRAPWSDCEFTLDLSTEQINVQFSYD